ncbi:hypothetical protein IscW_ISCW005221, partial [Ixodes scapularis]
PPFPAHSQDLTRSHDGGTPSPHSSTQNTPSRAIRPLSQLTSSNHPPPPPSQLPAPLNGAISNEAPPPPPPFHRCPTELW